MNKTYLGFLLAIFIIIVGALWYTRTPDPALDAGTSGDFGSYAYTCEGGIDFIMTPASDMGTIKIGPVTNEMYPPLATLADSPTDTGRRYRSANFEFHGVGESVELYDVSTQVTYRCTPQPKPDEAPFNWGD